MKKLNLKKLIISLLIFIIPLIGFMIYSNSNSKFCLTTFDCIYEKCENGCINKYRTNSESCNIKAANFHSYIWENTPCQCENFKCNKDVTSFCQKACADWKKDSCAEGDYQTAFFDQKCENILGCECLP